MYRGYDLKLEWNDTVDNDFYEHGLKLFNSDRKIIKKTLDDFTLNNGKLDGTRIRENWFPQMDTYDVFISHSHSNEKRAIAFAGYLYHQFEIRAFVDSSLWGYGNDLLRLIDDEYCYQKETKTYNYTSRNYSTSHVHMMLSTALMMMIDNTECLFFLNTPDSITVENVVNKTESPWIYAELAATRILRQNIPNRKKVKRFSEGGKVVNENLNIQYEVDLSHLTKINTDTIIEFNESDYTGKDALDYLYKITSNNLIKG